MTDLFLRSFSGINNRMPADKIGQSEVVSAINAVFVDGTIKVNRYIRKTAIDGVKTIVPTSWDNGTGFATMDLNKVFFVEINGILYWCSTNQTGVPKKRRSDGTEYDVGIAAPTVDPTQSDNGAGNVTGTNLQWAYTYYSSFDDAESPPSNLSTAASPAGRQFLIGVTASADPQVDHINIYRLNALGSLARVVQVANTTGTYADNVDDTGLGDLLTSTNYSLPPSNANIGDNFGIAGIYNGMCVIWSGRRVRWSVANKPNAWPETYYRDYPYQVRCVIPFGRQGFLVLTQQSLHILYGPQPEQLGNTDVDNTLGCIFPKSVVTCELGILFMSQYGLCRFGEGGVVKLGRSHLNDAFIASVVDASDTHSAAFVNGNYLLFSQDRILVANCTQFPDIDWTVSDFVPTADSLAHYQDAAQGIGKAFFSRWGA